MCPIIDPNQEEEINFKPGWYKAKVLSCEERVSKANNNPYLNWKIELESGDPSQRGQWVFMMTAYNGKGGQILAKLYRDTVDPMYATGPINTDDIIGRVLKVNVETKLDKEGKPTKYLQVMDTAALPASEQTFDYNNTDETIPF